VFWTAAPGWNRDAAIARMLERGSYEGEVVCHRGDGSPLLTEVGLPCCAARVASSAGR
jgi:hypothetical protein